MSSRSKIGPCHPLCRGVFYEVKVPAWFLFCEGRHDPSARDDRRVDDCRRTGFRPGPGHRPRPHQLQDGGCRQPRRPAPEPDRRRHGEASVRRRPRLPGKRAQGTRRPGVVAGAGLLEDELPARADYAEDAAGAVLQRRRVRRLLPPRRRAGVLGGRRQPRNGVLHARPGADRQAAVRPADRQLPDLSRVQPDAGRARPPGPLGLRRPRRHADPVRRHFPHRPLEPVHRALGRLVRHRHARQADAHGQLGRAEQASPTSEDQSPAVRT